jgi:hypothetical protein
MIEITALIIAYFSGVCTTFVIFVGIGAYVGRKYYKDILNGSIANNKANS